MSVALVSTPSRRASYTPRLAAWLDPRSSQLTISSLASGGNPNCSASTDITFDGSDVRVGRPLRGRARGPQAPAGLPGVGRGGHELVGVGHVGRERVGHRITIVDEREVDEEVVLGPVHVGQQTFVLVAQFDVADEADGRACW